MDVRNASVIVAIALAGGAFAVPAGAEAVGVQPTVTGQSLYGGDFLVESEVDHFVAFVFADEGSSGAARSGEASLTTEVSSPDRNIVWIAGSGVSLNGSEMNVDALYAAGFDSQLVARESSFAQWTVPFTPAPTLIADGGMQNPLTEVPLPAPLAMGGIGLLGMAGLVTLRRRR